MRVEGERVDVTEAAGNGYHVQIRFTAPIDANDEFSFDIIRGGACAMPDAKHSNLKEYDWCVDGTSVASFGHRYVLPVRATYQAFTVEGHERLR